ncbi:MAG TPA: cation:proton antiporter [Gaiellaceae bacterium]|nr:cation:proton antiporter [Gaiellaceae bacterium]
MPLAVEFPPESAEWVFFVCFAIILLGPLLFERLGFPGIIGVILGGLLVGPGVLGWIEREGAVESLGDLGILVLMFLAGLELDLDEFQVNRRGALTFGAFTFAIPFVLGIAVAASFDYGFATAMLFGSLWASHTLVAYPIVQEHGLLRDRSVGIAGGGTVMTDTLALSVLAIVAGSVASDARPAVVLLEVVVGIAILALFCAVVLPWVTRQVFAGVGQHRGARFLFVVVALTAAALVADRAGIEGIVGAFFAGLALNRLVPSRSRLMGQIEFVGGVLLIPFFLLSTGMLIDPEAFTERRVLALAAISLAVVFIGKLVAALVSARLLGLSRPQGRLLFGLSLAQAAATLAAVTIGVEIGLFDTPLLNATLVVVLVTVLVSSILTRSAARRIEPAPVQGERLAETILVRADLTGSPAVSSLAARLAMAKGGNVLVGAIAPAGGAPLEAARERAEALAREISAQGAEVSTVVRVDSSEAAALAAIVAEHGVSLVVAPWRRAALAVDAMLGGEALDLVALADVPVLGLVSIGSSDPRRVVLALDDADLAVEAQRDLAVACASIAAAAMKGRAVVVAPDGGAGADLARLVSDDAEVVVDGRSRAAAVAAIARADDLVLLPSRQGAAPLPSDAAAIAALDVECSVAVPTRPRAGASIVTGTATLVGSRRTG